MGMVKSISFLASFPNVNLNENILIVKCIMKL
jgi:hypothetical protein